MKFSHTDIALVVENAPQPEDLNRDERIEAVAEEIMGWYWPCCHSEVVETFTTHGSRSLYASALGLVTIECCLQVSRASSC